MCCSNSDVWVDPYILRITILLNVLPRQESIVLALKTIFHILPFMYRPNELKIHQTFLVHVPTWNKRYLLPFKHTNIKDNNDNNSNNAEYRNLYPNYLTLLFKGEITIHSSSRRLRTVHSKHPSSFTDLISCEGQSGSGQCLGDFWEEKNWREIHSQGKIFESNPRLGNQVFVCIVLDKWIWIRFWGVGF